MSRPLLEDSTTLDAILRSHDSGPRGHEARAIHERLRRLLHLRERYDETLGRIAVLFQSMEGWRTVGFASFDQYCEERLGMDPSEVERLAARARKQLRRLRNADGRAGAAAQTALPEPPGSTP
ncbi:MAG: hypothetical protein ACJ79H_09675 [Myxococcales bacterium]